MDADVRNEQVLSGSTNNKPVPVAAVTLASATTIHTTGSGIDEVYIWATNTSQSPAWVTLLWGDVTDPASVIAQKVQIQPNEPPKKLLDGVSLNGTLILKAYASVASVINLTGYANRIS